MFKFEFGVPDGAVLVETEWRDGSEEFFEVCRDYEVKVYCCGQLCASLATGDYDDIWVSLRDCFQQLNVEAAEHAAGRDVTHVPTKSRDGRFIEVVDVGGFCNHKFVPGGGWEAAFEINPEYFEHLEKESDLARIGTVCDIMSRGFSHIGSEVEGALYLLEKVGIEKYKNWEEFFGYLCSELFFATGWVSYVNTEILPDWEQLKSGRFVVGGKLVGGLAHPLLGLTFAITGKLIHFKNRNDLTKLIVYYGGKVVSTVGRNTDYLITNDSSSGSEKNRLARDYGVSIISEEEMLSMVGINSGNLNAVKELIGLS